MRMLEHSEWTKIRTWPARLVVLLIRVYQYTLAALLGGHCRFYPSCSAYGIEAVGSHGVRRGVVLGAKRLLKCHPWHPGGVDPVPPVDRAVRQN